MINDYLNPLIEALKNINCEIRYVAESVLIVLLLLKLTGEITMSWTLVLSPLIFTICLSVLEVIFLVILNCKENGSE